MFIAIANAIGANKKSVDKNVKIIDKEPIFDADFDIIQEATFLDGYRFDVMSKQEIDFGVNETTTTNPKHSFE